MTWPAALFSMTIHTTCCQAGAPADTPQGRDEDGNVVEPGGAGWGWGWGWDWGPGSPCGPSCGAVASPDGVGPEPDSASAGAPGTRAMPPSISRRGAYAPASRLATTTVSRPEADSASETTPLASTRCVTSTRVQPWRSMAPLCTTRGPVPRAVRNVIARSFQGRLEAWRSSRPRS